MRRHGAWRDERGFTLIEVMVTIIIMGIVLGIATSSWLGLVRSRQVDSATNEVAANLRLAHSQAMNRLADSDFTTPDPTPLAGTVPLSTYEIGPTGAVTSGILPDATQFATATEIRFKADGSAEVVSGSAAVGGIITITVRSSNDVTNHHDIQINTATSRISVVP